MENALHVWVIAFVFFVISAFTGCGSGSGSSHDSQPSCGTVIQNVNIPQNVTVPADQVEATERATEENGGEIFTKEVTTGGDVTLTGCQIITTGDTNTDDDTVNNHSGNSSVGGNS